MKLIKSCKPEHNPKLGKNSIQLGSLTFYRQQDNEFIRDDKEGIVTRALDAAAPQYPTGDEFAQMLGAAPGSINATAGSIQLSGRALSITRPIPNALIFCASWDERAKASFGYHDFYVIKDPDLFADRLTTEINKYLSTETRIQTYHGKVQYRDEVPFPDVARFAASNLVVEARWYFIKRSSFASQKEYRFVFVPVDQSGNTIPFHELTLRIRAASFMDLIE